METEQSPGESGGATGRARPRVLVVDVGGTNVKIRNSEDEQIRKHPSGSELSARAMVEAVLGMAGDWKYDVVSVGFPGPVVNAAPALEPRNLGTGWVDFDFEAAFGKPVRVINDAAMQALGSHEGGKMLFLGLGTGLGSAVVIHGRVEPMELAHLPYRKGRTFEDYVGKRGLKRLGRKKWEKHVHRVVAALKHALLVDYVVLGGGNAKKLEQLPEGAKLGHNANAFVGGFRLWGVEDS
jgi:polyphosphate glucokinase